ncbi:predicted protein [Streptomyces viridosporus ATCC 14672]|uniref:Predicted protein n=1 Tax=Streptomyces viridosporus (strain ATCC 14672 / DSM 40746 / JCM 4963 / KCTC 9882 / NRRL B-12104 / FH 1290) TaxID=566461 RepID=D6A172_STRV1|nr:predicted protein [Streptomyces viridosporus ATCC 14672]
MPARPATVPGRRYPGDRRLTRFPGVRTRTALGREDHGVAEAVQRHPGARPRVEAVPS